MAAISLRGVASATYEDGFAVRDVDLDVPDGRVCALIGPSGCGKSTLLRLVAGLEPVTAGRILLGGDDVTTRSPQERDVAWTAQDNPLYPHLDVEENIGFALRGRKFYREERHARVHAEARAAGVGRLLRRKPHTLSAGERQATGLARATVRLPAAYLLDEPLARIDAQQRTRMRAELARLFHGFDVPVLFATNDQVEALALGDDLAVLRDGRLVQHGDAQAVHARPETVFVATFVGDPGMNVMSGVLEAGARRVFVRVGESAVPLPHVPPRLRAQRDGTRVLLGVRPEHLRLGGEDAPLQANVERVELLGATRRVHVSLAGTDDPLVVRASGPGRLVAGAAVRLEVNAARAHLFDPVTEEALWHATEGG